MCKLWSQQFRAFKEAISASLQPGSLLVPEKISGARQLATPVVVAAAAGSTTSSRSEDTEQRSGDRSKSASPAYPQEDMVGKVAIVATSVNDVLQQLSSLTQVVWEMHGRVYDSGGRVHVQDSTPDDSLSSVGLTAESETSLASEGCELGGDFGDLVAFN